MGIHLRGEHSEAIAKMQERCGGTEPRLLMLHSAVIVVLSSPGRSGAGRSGAERCGAVRSGAVRCGFDWFDSDTTLLNTAEAGLGSRLE